jgi:type I restriction-modification system DNA methylase subunit
MNINDIISHVRDRAYMSGLDRAQSRVKSTGEVFTPTDLVREMLEKLPIDQFNDPTKTFLDPSCGDGQFLGEVLIRKLESLGTVDIDDTDFEQALSTIYGVDLMPDNVKLCQERLLCGKTELQHIVDNNIVEADSLKYHYRFDGSPPYDPPPVKPTPAKVERRKKLQEIGIFDLPKEDQNKLQPHQL